MEFDLQPTYLKNDSIFLQPLNPNDFEALFKVASDPLIWEQHPNKNRYQREVFEVFFEGAILSKGAFMVYDTNTKALIGSSRFYDYNKAENCITIGYTFIAKAYWGKLCNKALKGIMLNYAFKHVNTVLFYIGSNNIRSQKAIQKIGAIKIQEQNVTYFGEEEKLNFVYQINKHAAFVP